MDRKTVIDLQERVAALERIQGAGEGQVLSAINARLIALEEQVNEILDMKPMSGVNTLRTEVEGVSKSLDTLREEMKTLRLRTQLAKPGKGLRNVAKVEA